MSQASELSVRFEECEKERVAYKTELRELKARESRIMAEYAELEDENISLQKQLMQLKQAQVLMQSHHRNGLRSCIYRPMHWHSVPVSKNSSVKHDYVVCFILLLFVAS